MLTLNRTKILFLVLSSVILTGCPQMRPSFMGSEEKGTDVVPTAYVEDKKEKKVKFTTRKSGLQYRITKSVKGAAKPKATDKVTVHYEGKLDDGTVFDSSYKRGKPITFGLNQVIKGWTEGVQLMGVGETIELIIPSDLGYGDRGTGPIPGKATLHFKIELLKIN